jgi:hypothetical protein
MVLNTFSALRSRVRPSVDELLNEKNEPDVEKPEETADDPGSSGKSGKV